jgi:glycosyltransferase involved in cell wall biosynthesis
MPGAVLEAMALEAPIVASDVPPVREAVAHGETAWLVPVGQPEALAQGIVHTLEDPAAAAVRAARAQASFQLGFTVARAAEGMLAFYDHALSVAR